MKIRGLVLVDIIMKEAIRMRKLWPRLLLRLPVDAHAFVKQQAEWNGSSLNSEIVRCIRERMSQRLAGELRSAAFDDQGVIECPQASRD